MKVFAKLDLKKYNMNLLLLDYTFVLFGIFL